MALVINKESQLRRYYNHHTNTYEFMGYGEKLDIELLIDFDKPNTNILAGKITAEGKDIRAKNIDCKSIFCKDLKVYDDLNVLNSINANDVDVVGNIKAGYIYAHNVQAIGNTIQCRDMEVNTVNARMLIAESYIKAIAVDVRYIFTGSVRTTLLEAERISCFGSIEAENIVAINIHAGSIKANSLRYHTMIVGKSLECEFTEKMYPDSNMIILGDKSLDTNISMVDAPMLDPKEITELDKIMEETNMIPETSVLNPDATHLVNNNITSTSNIKPYYSRAFNTTTDYITAAQIDEDCRKALSNDLVFTNMDEMKPYYIECGDIKSYIFTGSDGYLANVVFTFDLDTVASIKAANIRAKDISAYDISAFDIVADNITSRSNIFADDIRCANISALTGIVVENITARNIDCSWIKADSIRAENISYGDMVFSTTDIICDTIRASSKNWSITTLTGDLITLKDQKEDSEEIEAQYSDKFVEFFEESAKKLDHIHEEAKRLTDELGKRLIEIDIYKAKEYGTVNPITCADPLEGLYKPEIIANNSVIE